MVKSKRSLFPPHFPSKHQRLLSYEGRGVSPRYSGFALPKNCDTVLFPGCALSGTRPARLLELFEHLRQSIPGLGIVLNCCTKPSHDLGRKDFFTSKFDKLRQALIQQGVRRVLVLCPSCYVVFSRYGAPLETQYVYKLLAEQPVPKPIMMEGNKNIMVHDPCTTRRDHEVHSSVRKILQTAAFMVEEMPHHGKKTFCCGEGGAVPFVDKQLARSWGDQRSQEAAERTSVPLTVTYCAGCVDFLRSRMRIVHLLDLLFAPEAALAGKVKVSRAPFTYLNRLLLKRRLKKLQTEQDQEAPQPDPGPQLGPKAGGPQRHRFPAHDPDACRAERDRGSRRNAYHSHNP